MNTSDIKIYYENLPKYETGSYKGSINWNECVGKYVAFKCIDVKGEFLILDYNNESHYIKLKYKDKIYNMNHSSFMKSHIYKMFYPYQFKYNVGDIIYDNQRDLELISKRVEYVVNSKGKQNLKKYYGYKCNKCGYDKGEIIEQSLYNGIGCACCANKIVVSGINDIPTTDPWMIPYFQGGYKEAKLYSSGSGAIIYPICPDCGKIKKKPIKICTIHTYHSIGCECSDGKSYPNKFSYAFLEQLPIENWETEYSPKWAKPYRYDNYFEYKGNKYILEMDGELGHGNKTYSHKIDIKGKEIDKLKDKMAKQHNIKLIRIDCIKSDLNYIKNNIIGSELKNIFDLSNINWAICDLYATKNIIKEICKDFEDNKNKIPPFMLCEKYKIGRTTLYEYLLKGNKLGWCKYNPQETHKIWSSYSGRTYTKCIDVYYNNELIATYPSIKKCSEQSINDLGISFIASKISNALNKGIQYKGYIFKLHK